MADRPLPELARIARRADTRLSGIIRSSSEPSGLKAAAIGFTVHAADDFENMRLQFPLYDALYDYCRMKVEEGQELDHTIHQLERRRGSSTPARLHIDECTRVTMYVRGEGLAVLEYWCW